MSHPWIVSISPINPPNVDDIPEKHQPFAGVLLKTWEKYVPIKPGEPGDYEEFFEQAIRLHEAINSFGPENVWIVHNNPVALNAKTGETKPVNEIENASWYGIVFQYPNSPDPRVFQKDKGDKYIHTKTFHEFAGRQVTLAGFEAEESPEVLDVVFSYVSQGVTKLIIKTAAAKKGFWRFNFNEGMSRKEIETILYEEMDWSLVSAEGLNNAFLVQETIPMRYEYRLFVVNNKIVTGAGCVVENTPLDNHDRFDPYMREWRFEKTEVVNRVKLLQTYLAFGEKIVESFHKEEPDVKNYVIDLAVDGNNKPLLIERNGLDNAGLYACDVRYITDALNHQ